MARSVYVAAVEGFTGKSTVALGVLERAVQAGRADCGLPPGRARGGCRRLRPRPAGLARRRCPRRTTSAPASPTPTCTGTLMRRSPRSWSAITCWPSRPTSWWWWEATTPTSARRPSSPSTPALRPTWATPVMLVLNAHGKSPEELTATADVAAAELNANLGSLFAVVANRADPAGRDEALAAIAGYDVPAFALPDEPLLYRTLGRRHDGCLRRHADQWRGASAGAGGHRRDGRGDDAAERAGPAVRRGRVVAPGDRPEVVLGVLTAHVSRELPADVRDRSERRHPPGPAGRQPDRGTADHHADHRDRPRHQGHRGRAHRASRSPAQGVAAQGRDRARAVSTSTSTGMPCSTGSRSRAAQPSRR